MTIEWTGDLKQDWKSLCDLWRQSDRVLQSEVGPLWEMPPQHEACLQFEYRYPDSKTFLIKQLSDLDPRIAAYAFKCLVRVAKIEKEEIPSEVLSRADEITTHMHSFLATTSVGQFINRYFEVYQSQDDLIEEQNRTIGWQLNELAEYESQTEINQ
jgi:hypothetical protein